MGQSLTKLCSSRPSPNPPTAPSSTSTDPEKPGPPTPTPPTTTNAAPAPTQTGRSSPPSSLSASYSSPGAPTLPALSLSSIPESGLPPPQPIPSPPISTNSGPPPGRADDQFVRRVKDKLYLAGESYRFASLNAPELLEGHEWEARDTMRTLAGLGRAVTRTYTLKILSTNIPVHQAHIIGYDPARGDWVWNEQMMVLMDTVLDLASKYEVKLIIPIINQDWGTENNNWAGNFTDLIRLHYGFPDNVTARSKVDWWTDGRMMGMFKRLLNTLLNRINTRNGVRYGSDPTILAWETGNELESPNSLPAPAPWTLAVASELKRLAPNTLVMDGSFARNGDVKKCYRQDVLQSSLVDILSYHYYGGGEGERVVKDADHVKKAGKAFIVGEYGFFDSVLENDKFLEQIRNSTAAGSLIWSLRPHSVMGGFKTHNEGPPNYSFHAGPQHHLLPPETRPAKEFDKRETHIVNGIRDESFRIVGEEIPPFPTPPPPDVWVESRRRPIAPTFRTSALIGSRRSSSALSASRSSTPTLDNVPGVIPSSPSQTVPGGGIGTLSASSSPPGTSNGNAPSSPPPTTTINGTSISSPFPLTPPQFVHSRSRTHSRNGSASNSALPSAHTSLANLAAFEQGLSGSALASEEALLPFEVEVKVLKWRGSAWAREYEVWRCGRGPEMCAEKCVREWVGEGEKDKIGWELPPGAETGGARWKVRAVGVDGHKGAWSNEVVVPASPRDL